MVSKETVLSQYMDTVARYPKLNPPRLSNINWHVNGYIDVTDDEGTIWDTFAVTIIIPSDFPEKLPILIETGNVIPNDMGWHNKDYCCVSPDSVVYNSLGTDLNLLNWIEKYAHPFLANYVYRKKTGRYANGEYDHGVNGIIQGYEKIFNISGIQKVQMHLSNICEVLKLGRNERCFCKSGKKFKNCFGINPFEHRLSNIPYVQLLNDLNTINLEYKKLLNLRK